MEELKNISIRGRMAYLISSFENVLLHYMVLCQDLVQVKMRNFSPF